MTHLDDVTVADLRDALAEVEGKTPTKRLLAAIAYQNGINQTELAAWFGVGRRTIYGWLTRFESGSLAATAVDADRPGRPRKLSADQQNTLEHTLRDPPPDVGLDAPSWTPALVQEHLRKDFDVEYSRPSCRRLLKEAGLRYRNRRSPTSESNAPAGSSGRWTYRC